MKLDGKLKVTSRVVPAQLNQSGSGVSGLVEVSSGRRRLWAQGEVAAIDRGYRQAVELLHSYPQVPPPENLKLLTPDFDQSVCLSVRSSSPSPGLWR